MATGTRGGHEQSQGVETKKLRRDVKIACAEEKIGMEYGRSEKNVKGLQTLKQIVFQNLGQDPGFLFFKVLLLLSK